MVVCRLFGIWMGRINYWRSEVLAISLAKWRSSNPRRALRRCVLKQKFVCSRSTMKHSKEFCVNVPMSPLLSYAVSHAGCAKRHCNRYFINVLCSNRIDLNRDALPFEDDLAKGIYT